MTFNALVPAVLTLASFLVVSSPVWGQTPLTCGRSPSDAITEPSQQNSYTLNVAAGDLVRINIQTTSGTLVPWLELYDPAGTRVASNQSVEQTLNTAGTYLLLVRDTFQNRTGTYALVWRRLNSPCGAAPISCGQAISGSIRKPLEASAFNFAANAGDVVRIRQVTTSGSLSASMELLDPTGKRVALAPSIDATLGMSGTYGLLVGDTAGTRTGNFSLAWQRVNRPCGAITLLCGRSVSGSITVPVETDAYSITTTAGDTLRIRQVTTGPLRASMELFDPLGKRIASGGSIDSTVASSGNHLLLVSDILGRGVGNYTLGWQRVNNPCAVFQELSVSDITPNRGGNTGNVTITISGFGFQNGAVVQLIDAERVVLTGQNTALKTPPPLDPVIVAGQPPLELQSTFDLRGQAARTIQVRVMNPDGTSAFASEPFGVLSGGEARLTLDLIGPPIMRAGRESIVTAVLRNQGEIDLDDPLILSVDLVQSPQQVRNFLAVDSLSRLAAGAQLTMSVPLTPQPGCHQVIVTPTQVRQTTCEELIEKRRELLEILNEINRRIQELGCNCDNPNERPECKDLCRRKKRVEDGLRRIDEELARCPRPAAAGEPLQTARLDFCAVTSWDPNDKRGVGVLSNGFIRTDNPLSYTIFFENLVSAAVSAQEVVITDQLDPGTMDFSTFGLSAMTIGPERIELPLGLYDFAAEVDLRPANSIIVRISANFSPATGVLTWRFISLDPVTGRPPEDPFAGFLPPNRVPPQGEGSVQFTIMPRQGLPTGTQIRNRAEIIFDVNRPIVTPEWMNTIDNTKPLSQIFTRPPPNGASVELRWSGTDQGSAIQDYTIYVSRNFGPFELWLLTTSQTPAVFAGQPGNTYSFYSIARDKVGNVEDPPSSPDLTVTLPACVSATDVSGQIRITRGGFRFNNSTQRLVQTVTLQNTSLVNIAGPVSLVLDSLSPNATLFNKTGSTTCALPAGSPFVNANVGGDGVFSPGETATVILEFTNPSNAGITYTTKMLAGGGDR